jgi:hypothetical protein
MNFSTLRTFITFFTAILLAGPVLASTDPIIKRPTAPKRTHQISDTVTKTPVSATTKKSATRFQTAPTTTLLAVAPTAAAQPAATPTAPQVMKLKGIVLNADGRPCPGASVYPAGAPRQLVITDANGAFVLPVPASEAVSLRVEYFGIGSSRVEVAAPSAEVLRITLGK